MRAIVTDKRDRERKNEGEGDDGVLKERMIGRTGSGRVCTGLGWFGSGLVGLGRTGLTGPGQLGSGTGSRALDLGCTRVGLLCLGGLGARIACIPDKVHVQRRHSAQLYSFITFLHLINNISRLQLQRRPFHTIIHLIIHELFRDLGRDTTISPRPCLDLVLEVRKIELRIIASQNISCRVVCKSGFVRRVESPQPNPRPLSRQPYFGHPFPPLPLSHSSVQLLIIPLRFSFWTTLQSVANYVCQLINWFDRVFGFDLIGDGEGRVFKTDEEVGRKVFAFEVPELMVKPDGSKECG
ncbi:leucine--tRNA ligase [Striga asiatica]|uniref:Leucine--tRNA ligase n=1 Tax=Striga asiatica TaxID=4170 RepID=A0A5A7PUI2_STRAF|nr:leucine--tRNA ligase [Striga asiatica]